MPLEDSLLETFELFATPSPILFTMCRYSATCLLIGFDGPQDDATEDPWVLTRLLAAGGGGLVAFRTVGDEIGGLGG